MLSKNEKKLLFLVRYAPILIVSIISVTITLLLFWEKEKNYKNDIENIKIKFYLENQNRIKHEVYRVHDYINYEKQKGDKFLKDEIKTQLLQANKIMTYIYEKYKNTENKKQITNRIKDSLREYRFNKNRGYLYIYDKKGTNVFYSLDESIEGENYYDFKNVSGNYTIRDMIELSNSDEFKFYEWHWYKPNDNSIMKKKIGSVLNFKPYNWFIGTGEYVEDYENESKKRILEYINTIKYSKNGYVFIVDDKGSYLSHVKKSYINKNRINLKDKNGFMITQEIIKTAQNIEGYIRYIGTIKPDTKLPSEKITFVKAFEEWDWAIGTGFYTDELDKQIKAKENHLKEEKKNNIINLLYLSVCLTIIFLIISIYLSKVLEKYLTRYRKEVLKYIDKNREKDTMLAQQSKMAAMGEMIENIAHQWRQPLNLISVSSSGIKFRKEHNLLSDDEFVEGIDQITKSSNYLSQTIEDFREFFSTEKQMSLFNLKETFEKTFNLTSPQLSMKNIVLVKDLEDVEIRGYENELIQVIINLINNSKDELIKNEEMIRLIFVTLESNNKEAIINIKDNAGGVNEDIINRIFEPYFTTKHKSQGTGIGLYMSREIIVKHMEGSIEVRNVEYTYENNSYKGANFEIKLSLDK